MLILIDESGDTGFKESSSRYFILTMIVFKDADAQGRYPSAERTAATIKNGMIALDHKPEFHFSNCSRKIRQSFFQSLNEYQCDFDVHALIIDKKLIHSDHLKTRPQNFYNFLLKQLLVHNSVVGATIKIDGQKSKIFRRALSAYLRRGHSGMLAKLKFVDSRNDVLIQLADMACGAIAYNYSRTDKLEADIYLKMLGKRVKTIWPFQ